MNSLITPTRRNGQAVCGESRNQRSPGAWLLERLRCRSGDDPPLRVLGRIRVTPRQGLLLIEAEGERLLVATSDGSAATIYPLGTPAEIRVEGSCA